MAFLNGVNFLLLYWLEIQNEAAVSSINKVAAVTGILS